MKKSKYRRLKSLSFILSVIMIICSIPMTAVAETVEPTETAEDDSYVYDVMESEEIELETTEIAQITEVESLREENVKHFKLPDGTYEMVVYGEAVHRKGSDGKWKDIDNNLELTAIKNVNMFASSDMRTTFASSFGAGQPLMTLSENGYSVSMSFVLDSISSDVELMSISEPVAPAIQNATARENNARFDTISQAAEINNKSSIKYQNVKANTDIEYVMSGNDIKENIIIKAKGTNYIYRFDLALDGLIPELVNNTVILKDSESDEIKYVIPEPYMYDADGNISYAVTYTLTDHGNGIYRLTVTADSSWINAEGRAFPVVVDPTFVTTAYRVVGDTYIDSSVPNTNYGSSIELWLSNQRTTFIKFSNIDLPYNVRLDSAYLNIAYYYWDTTAAGSLTVGAYMVNNDWNESSLTYNTANQNTNLGLRTNLLSTTDLPVFLDEAQTIRATNASPARKDIDVTDAADLWLADVANYGIALKRLTGGVRNSVILKSRETEHDAYLRILYSYPFEEGVYAFQNEARPTLWMDTRNDSHEEGAYIQQYAYEIPPTLESYFSRGGLFKISRREDLGTYVIRSMLNNELSPHIYNENGTYYVKNKAISFDDNLVAAEDTFYIDYLDVTINYRQYVIRPYGTNDNLYISSAHETASGIGGQENSYLQGFDYSSYDDLLDVPDNAKWNLVKYIGEQKNTVMTTGIDDWENIGAIVNTEYNIKVMCSSTVINRNRAMWTPVDDEDNMLLYTGKIISFTRDTNTASGNVTPKWPGVFKIRFNFYNGYSLVNNVKETRTYRAILPENFNYVIQNADTKKFADIEITNPVQNEFEVDNPQMLWEIEHVENSRGYVRIKSVSDNQYLGVNPLDGEEYDIVLSTTQNNYTLWKIDITSRKTLVFRCRATEDDGWAMYSPNSSNRAAIRQTTYTNDETNLTDEWFLYRVNDASFMATESSSRASKFDEYIETLSGINYTDCYSNQTMVWTGVTQDELLSRMRFSKITFIITHGTQTYIQLTGGGELTREEISSLPSDALEYSELIIYASCEAAKGGANADNLVSATVDAGARTVIGFEDKVHETGVQNWFEVFFQHYITYYGDETKTIEEICNLTHEDILNSNDPFYHGTIGNVSFSLKNHVIGGEQAMPNS